MKLKVKKRKKNGPMPLNRGIQSYPQKARVGAGFHFNQTTAHQIPLL